MKIRTITLLLLSTVIILFSCKKDPTSQVGPDGVKTTATFNISIEGSNSTKNATVGVDAETAIKNSQLTLYFFNAVSGLYEFKDVVTVDVTTSVTVTTGNKHIIAIAGPVSFLDDLSSLEKSPNFNAAKLTSAITSQFSNIAGTGDFLMMGETAWTISEITSENVIPITVSRLGSKVVLAYNPAERLGSIVNAEIGNEAVWMLAQVNQKSYLFDKNLDGDGNINVAPVVLTPTHGGTAAEQADHATLQNTAYNMPAVNEDDIIARAAAMKAAYTYGHLTTIPTTTNFTAATPEGTEFTNRSMTSIKATGPYTPGATAFNYAYDKSLYATENINHRALNGNTTYVIVRIKVTPTALIGEPTGIPDGTFYIGLDADGAWDNVYYGNVAALETASGKAYVKTLTYAGGLNYYRVNISDPEYFVNDSKSKYSVRRNFVYKIDIRAVTGLGSPDSDSESDGNGGGELVPGANITANITIADWTARDIITDLN